MLAGQQGQKDLPSSRVNFLNSRVLRVASFRFNIHISDWMLQRSFIISAQKLQPQRCSSGLLNLARHVLSARDRGVLSPRSEEHQGHLPHRSCANCLISC